MLTEKHWKQLAKNIERIESRGAIDAYYHMLGHAACLEDYKCHPNNPAKDNLKRDFQYHIDGKQSFAFTINSKHLLFYFRIPYIKKFGKHTVLDKLTGAKETDRGEVTIRIETVDEAKKVLEFAF
jgi:hypothetical protein